MAIGSDGTLPVKPVTRGDCAEGERPCPWASCRHHLYLDVNEATGTIKLHPSGRELVDLAETCALDVADRGGVTLEEIGEILSCTRERARQIEALGLHRLAESGEIDGARDFARLDAAAAK